MPKTKSAAATVVHTYGASARAESVNNTPCDGAPEARGDGPSPRAVTHPCARLLSRARRCPRVVPQPRARKVFFAAAWQSGGLPRGWLTSRRPPPCRARQHVRRPRSPCLRRRRRCRCSCGRTVFRGAGARRPASPRSARVEPLYADGGVLLLLLAHHLLAERQTCAD